MMRDSTDRVAAVQETNIDGRYIASARGPVVAARRTNSIRRLSTTADSVAASGDTVKVPSAHSRVLDCACGTGQLAVGLASLGLDVVATDASLAMVRRAFNPEAEGYMVVAGRE
jgi:2-polyprenyl-3-methyl-5-hydroxy-6-metoxy-1,4-benzoquinol methylase